MDKYHTKSTHIKFISQSINTRKKNLSFFFSSNHLNSLQLAQFLKINIVKTNKKNNYSSLHPVKQSTNVLFIFRFHKKHF